MIKGKKKFGIIDSLVLTDYILYKGGAMSHLKLQKVLYYIQAYHLAYFNLPLIEDDFQAWVHGPVSRKVFNNVRDLSVLYDEIHYFQAEGEEHIEKKMAHLVKDQLELIDEIILEYGALSGIQLESLTHSESPWINARRGFGASQRCEEIISKDVMRTFYKKEIYG